LFPFVIAVVAGELEDKDFDYMYREYRKLHDRDQRFFLAQETRRVKLPNAIVRRRLGELNRDFTDDIEQHVVQIGVIVASKVFAGAIRAIYWLSREARPTHYASTALECWQNAVKTCAADGIALSDEGLAFVQSLDQDFKRGGDFADFL
jgi:hypothetical protein